MDEISQLESDRELGQALSRLERNRDYKKVIQSMYLDGGAITLTKNLKTTSDRPNGNVQNLFAQLAARSDLYSFIGKIKEDGYAAAQVLSDYQQEANDNG